MPTFEDTEFGIVTVRRSAMARMIKVSVAPSGGLRVTLPSYVPLLMAKRTISKSRPELRKLLESQPRITLTDGMTVGKSHSLHTRESKDSTVKTHDRQIIVGLAPGDTLDTPGVDTLVRAEIRKVLRKEAKHYLPRRLEYLATQHGYSYSSARFSHASSRWGSCSSNGTISLNIALMMLPNELIDYVILHELAHTKQMNHSSAFWKCVEQTCPNYQTYRRQLKRYTPTI